MSALTLPAAYLLIGFLVWLVFGIAQRRNPYGPNGASFVFVFAWPVLVLGLALYYLQHVMRRRR